MNHFESASCIRLINHWGINTHPLSNRYKEQIDDILCQDMKGLDIGNFNELLSQTSSFIAGSWLLNSILNVKEHDSVLTIWVPHHDDNDYEDDHAVSIFLGKMGYHTFSTMYPEENARWYLDHVLFYRNFPGHQNKNLKPLKIMYLKQSTNPMDDHHDVISMFRIVASQWLYDGREVKTAHIDAYWDAVTKRISFSDNFSWFSCMPSLQSWITTLTKIQKYRHNGFNNPDEKQWKKVLPNLYYVISQAMSAGRGKDVDNFIKTWDHLHIEPSMDVKFVFEDVFAVTYITFGNLVRMTFKDDIDFSPMHSSQFEYLASHCESQSNSK